ncbi:MAG: sulfotransferase family 2 domain-containing protein [Anaerolineae bacterium]|nr:sulfotransferase family 2 domain-containing protein [Anaerolineae bacterium]
MTPAKLIFLHIPKNAGMSIRQIVARQYIGQPVFVFGGDHRQELQQFMALSQAERDAYQCIMGHIRYGVHQLWSDPATYITLLRDPVERTISNYYYIQRHAHHARNAHYRGVSLLEYAQKETRGERQTRWLVGFRPDGVGEMYGDDHPLPADALEIAKEHLRTHFSVVGLVEEFDQTLLLLQKALGWQNIYYARRNVNEGRPRREQVPPETLEYIRQHSEPDVTLYQYARTLFEQQSQAYGDTLAADLAAFRRRNATFGQMWSATAGLRETGVYRQIRRWLGRKA